VYDLGGNAMTLEKVGQSKEPHGQEVDPDEMTDRPVIIIQFGDVEKNKIKAIHGGNCKMLTRNISTSSQEFAKGKTPASREQRFEFCVLEFLTRCPPLYALCIFLRMILAAIKPERLAPTMP
jgi:hypothetical protein